jgi:hypothetical protein
VFNFFKNESLKARWYLLSRKTRKKREDFQEEEAA